MNDDINRLTVPLETLAGQNFSRRGLLESLGAAAVGISLSACHKPRNKSSSNGGKEDANLLFYNWDTYIGDNTLADFNKTNGITVNMDRFANNDELFAKMRAGNPGYDVIVPTNDFVERLIKSNLLTPLNPLKIPNTKNIAPEHMEVDYDPGRLYSRPYTWLVLGIGYRKSKVKSIPDSWKYLYDSDEYKGRISLFEEAGDLIRLGARYLGHSVNAVTPEIIKQVEAMLIKQKPYIKVFHHDDGQDLLAKGEVDLVLEYNGDIAQKMAEDKDIDFVIPKEGSQLNSDNLCIPVGAKHPNNAHKFINFILDAQYGADIYKKIKYPTPNMAAKAIMDDSYRNNPVIFPDTKTLAKCEYSRYQGAEMQKLMEDALTRIKAA